MVMPTVKAGISTDGNLTAESKKPLAWYVQEAFLYLFALVLLIATEDASAGEAVWPL